jgi:glycosyltransferase involved in cell wall biosynthesis
MGNTPSISLVIPTYNRAHYLGETIDSVLSQQFQDFELIVVDDGSTDATQEVVSRYGPRVRFLRQENRGPSSARNLGVFYSRGDWISFQDSDDLSLPNHLETLYSCVKQRPGLGMVFANGVYLGGPVHGRETIIPATKSRRLAQRGVRLRDVFDKSIVRLQAALVSKRCYREIGGHDETLRISEDLDLAFRLIARYPVAYLDQVVFAYRRHPGNTSANQELRLRENIRVIEKLLMQNHQAEQELGRRRVATRLAYRYYRLAKARWRERRSADAKEAIGKAVRLCPLSPRYRFYQVCRG